MRVLVIGGSGYVAGLVRPVLAAQHDVRVLDPRPSAGDHDRDHVLGTATDPVALARAMRGVDAVVHAALGAVDEDGFARAAQAFEVNVTSVHLTLLAAHQAGVRHVVHLSSLSVYQDCAERRLDESVPPDATDLYGLTKRLAEQVCEAAVAQWGMSVTVLRLAWPTTDEAWPAWALPGAEPVLNRAADGTLLPALAAGDLSRAVLAALEHREGFAVFHVTGDGSGRRWNPAKAGNGLGWRALRR
ncbi:NAD(P)-dependent oxidoreductase [Kitasatospora sp. RB6PN24]|uniref:NAD-dependent epimerase/dehydratase family protein n=1 Tax=Kitasatospora humi TaxID=2893891 RepID=UPI001E39FE10|nr:NAD(P)-dependent oxidoreductase [Kitasatospora humi]MCC9306186.1 NAD(P)-dependent oxidoreductase [Kitasatospora humi]